MNKIVLLLTCNLLSAYALIVHNENHNYSACSVKEAYNLEGHLNIALLVNKCINSARLTEAYINSTIWTVNKLNSINFTSPLNLGLSIYEVCSEEEYYNPIFKLFKGNRRNYLMGTISSNVLTTKIQNFADSLDIHLRFIDKYRRQLVEAAVKLLNALSVTNGVIVYSENYFVLQEFYKFTWDSKICVEAGYILSNASILNLMDVAENYSTVIVFAGTQNVKTIINNSLSYEERYYELIFALLDDTDMLHFPVKSLIIQPSYTAVESLDESTPLLFDVANPILNLVLNVSNFIKDNCNDTNYKQNCFRNTHTQSVTDKQYKFTQLQILSFLKSEYLKSTFSYSIYRADHINGSIDTYLVKIFNYKIFDGVIVDTGSYFIANAESLSFCSNCSKGCINFKHVGSLGIPHSLLYIQLRFEPWVFGVLAIGALGLSFCLAIFFFLVIRICKRDILEGNPALTIFLLISVMLMYSSVIPFCLVADKEYLTTLCILRALTSTLSYAFALSLLLARNILLATINKEVGFMAHISGPVQSFLTLFIFGVQGALSLQFVSHCHDIFRGLSFVYLMSYNVMLLILLVVIAPLNARVQRNYKEGKHFTIAVALMACVWSCWIPGYAVLKENFRDATVCFGLLATASILLGCIFIPRTYRMTIAAARDRIANALPTLPTSSSIIDVYRANSQPIYDCINIAAINAASIARNGLALPPPPSQQDIYSAATVRAYDDLDFARCMTPSNSDKVTRF